MSTKLFDLGTLVLYKNGSIFAAGHNEEDGCLGFLVELNLILDVVKKFEGRGDEPVKIDANENYLAVGYGSGFVDVYSRKELDRNGTCKKVVVS